MKYEIRITKQGFLGKDKIDIKKLTEGTDLHYGLFDEIGVLEEGKCTEDSAFIYQEEDAGVGAFIKTQVNEKTQSGEVIITINGCMTNYEMFRGHYFLGKIIEAVKKQFFTVKIFENGVLITQEMSDDDLHFGKNLNDFIKIWEDEFEVLKENSLDGFIQGPLFPRFMDKYDLNGYLSYSSAIMHTVEDRIKYAAHEFFTDDNGTKKIRFFIEENKSAVMPVDARTIKDHWNLSAVISINGKDFPYNAVIYELKKSENKKPYDRRQIQYSKLTKVQLKRLAEAVQKNLDSQQFADFNFKLAVISNIVNKNPSFRKEFEEDIMEYAEDHRSRENDFLSDHIEKVVYELKLTESDLEKVTHLDLRRENDFYFDLKPEWNGEDSLFDIENFKGIELLENLETYSYDGLICAKSLLEELSELKESDEDTDETDYSAEEENDEDDSDEDEEVEDSDESEESEETDSGVMLLAVYQDKLNLSVSDEEKSFVREQIQKYCPEYEEGNTWKNNRIGVVILYLNGSLISQNMNRETRELTIKQSLETGYVKNYGNCFTMVNNTIDANEVFSKVYHIFTDETDADDDEEEESFYSKDDSYEILETVEKQTEIPSVEIEIHASDNERVPLTKSKFGGFPYWPKNMEYPVSTEGGEKLVLLAQINFAEVPHLEDFPESGILQFFVKADDLYGCGFGETVQDNWRVIFHEKIEEPMTEEELSSTGVKTAADIKGDNCCFPFDAEFALSFEKSMHSIGLTCEGFDKAVENAAKSLNLPLPEEKVCGLTALNDNAYEDFYDEYQVGHRIGGYPYFTQSDPRSEGDGYDVLLLQIDTDSDGGHEIMWGDSGIANFFITREDLKKRDFSKVIYNWDCY